MSLGRVLEWIRGFAIILACWGAGELASRYARLPLPGSVTGMLVLTALLHMRVVPLTAVRAAAELLIRWMALFFVPAGAAVLLYLPLLRANLLAIVAAATASIVVVLLSVGMIMQRMAPADAAEDDVG